MDPPPIGNSNNALTRFHACTPQIGMSALVWLSMHPFGACPYFRTALIHFVVPTALRSYESSTLMF